jgi:type III pantothenate kinase
MLIVCDIGNSFIKSAVFRNNKLTDYSVLRDFSSILNSVKREDAKEIAVTTVVPSKLRLLKQELSNNYRLKPFIINKNLKFNISIKYSTPQTLGMDRICSVEGAYYLLKTSPESDKYGKNNYLICIDCGTATTINVIQYPNNFIGGVIAPGLDMMFASLHKRTAQLPKITADHYKTIIGNSTKSSIASGVINSTVGVIHETIASLSKQPKKVFITGGNAKYIIPHLRFDVKYEKALVLYGIKAIYKKNTKSVS